MIIIESKRTREQTLFEKYPHAIIIDVTSKAKTSLVKLSPFYPHGDIPIPFSENRTAICVEGIWQGLKVFENEDIDITSFSNSTMKNIKRTIRKHGKLLGHRKGVYGTELLSYIDARILIYLPSYLWVLENKAIKIIERIKQVAISKDFVFLDYQTNCDILNCKMPLSHACLVKMYIEENFPKTEDLYFELHKRKSSSQECNATLNITKELENKAKLQNSNNQLTLF